MRRKDQSIENHFAGCSFTGLILDPAFEKFFWLLKLVPGVGESRLVIALVAETGSMTPVFSSVTREGRRSMAFIEFLSSRDFPVLSIAGALAPVKSGTDGNEL